MNITFILSSLWLSGGVRDIIEIANRLVLRKHNVAFVVVDGTIDTDVLEEIHPNIKIIATNTKGARSIRLINMLILSVELSFKVPNSDVIISTQTPTTVSTFIAAHILKRGRAVWYYQDYIEMFLDRPLFQLICKNALRWHECAVVLSRYSYDELKKYVSSKPIFISGMGLSGGEYFRPLDYHERKLIRADLAEKKVILYLGDTRPRKGWGDFWKAIQIVNHHHPDTFVWVVSKDYCPIDSEVPHRFIYRPSRAEIAQLYASCDVFVLPTWWESFGIPGLEALANGAPMVMTDSRGGREYGRSEENCLIVPPRQPEKMADAIIRLLEDEQLAERFRLAGPQTANDFNWEKAVDRFEDALLKTLSETVSYKLFL